MELLTRQTARAGVAGIDSEKKTVRLCVSSHAVDSYGSIILADGIDHQSRYAANPIFCWQHPLHDMCGDQSADRILGKAIGGPEREGDKTFYTYQFAVDINPAARMCFEMYEGGYLNACSVGLSGVTEVYPDSDEEKLDTLPDDIRSTLITGRDGCKFVIARSVLIEVSACYVGANPEALAARSVDQRMEVRERALCQRAQRMADQLDERLARIEAAAEKLERLALSPEERRLADFKAELESKPELRALLGLA